MPHSGHGRGKPRFDDDESEFDTRSRYRLKLPPAEQLPDAAELDGADRWSTWDQSTPTERGPLPRPRWLVTELAATDTDLGIIKTGKEADVFLLRRAVPGTSRSCLLAAKRYRSAEHRLFHRDAEYREGRRVRESRDNRAMAKRTAIGREMIARQWVNAEFTALSRFFSAGIAVPYPVQVLGTELLMEFIGEPDGAAAPRLAETGLRGDALADLWSQLVQSMMSLARLGFAHGDLSAYNLLVHEGRLVMIDIPQVVDVIASPRGADFIDRDAANVGKWFTARGLGGLDGAVPSPPDLAAVLRAEARLP